MEKGIFMTLLYDIYGELLTKTQQEIFSEYYLYNLSLREIASNREISYQGVRDCIKKCENMLETFESKLGLLKIQQNMQKAYSICRDSKDLNKNKQELLKLLE